MPSRGRDALARLGFGIVWPFSVTCFQVARCRRGPLICTLYAMDLEAIEWRRRKAEAARLESSEDGGHPRGRSW